MYKYDLQLVWFSDGPQNKSGKIAVEGASPGQVSLSMPTPTWAVSKKLNYLEDGCQVIHTMLSIGVAK